MTVQEAIKYLRMATDEAEGYCDEYREMCEMSIQALEKIEKLETNKTYNLYRQYLSIGTVEELKEAREKQVAKKPKKMEKDAINDLDTWCECSCGAMKKVDADKHKQMYCWKCGQLLSWEEGETSD